MRACRARHLRANQLLLAWRSSVKTRCRRQGTWRIWVTTLFSRGLGTATTRRPIHLPRRFATIQSNSFVRRVSWVFLIAHSLVLLVAVSGIVRRFSLDRYRPAGDCHHSCLLYVRARARGTLGHLAAGRSAVERDVARGGLLPARFEEQKMTRIVSDRAIATVALIFIS